ncbi:MAG: tRNA (adenosine(37)-N6)-threonylcarbamoyltransferase complex ATPase subunit type 1 TsaE, partial [Candidatus Pacebacteria bacterium]|nr:tRNA (adenosine(37)-N6)-threonylcarbamoyltransferase complex ATPase subunit type 1 TsaE [Candidatus Paceibacterota bacterium]
TDKMAKDLLDFIVAHRSENRATLVGFSGVLGSGKTTFSQVIARELGVVDQVTSPTFVIEKKYQILNPKFSTHYSQLIHIDAYRLEGGAELSKLGFADILADLKNLIILEWPEKVADILPKDMIEVKFEWLDDQIRAITF